MHFTKSKLAAAVAVAATITTAPNVLATNGMNMQGYGPIAYGTGGASMAYDNGVAAVMNNPATIGLMEQGNRIDAAFGALMPNVDASMPGFPSSHSDAELYLMPAFGYARKSDKLTYGVGLFAQGGMGTEYSATSFLALNSGQNVGSQLGVGRFLIPLAFNITPDFVIGGTIDYVWASLDLKMAATGAQMAGLVTNCSGSGCNALIADQNTNGTPDIQEAPWVRVDFSDGDFTDFSGEATGAGFAGKIGAVWKVDPTISLGASYHTKTSLDDLETSNGSLSSPGGTLGTGTIKVRDFQWPATLAAGVAWNATKTVMVVADIKQIYWKDVMEDFKMTYEGPVAAAGNAAIDFALEQNWEDQTVLQLGASWHVSDPLTLRAGFNYADSQIPDAYVNPLFPAIMKQHYTIGVGYTFNQLSSIDFGFAYAPQNSQTNQQNVESSTGGTSFQAMYSAKF